jgi:acylphosphatase
LGVAPAGANVPITAMTSPPDQPHQRREVYYSGRVQGVGFRYTTRAIAARFAVAGFVENRPDGRVRLVVEATAAELDRFLAAIADEMDAYIKHTDSVVSPATDEFEQFEIRH